MAQSQLAEEYLRKKSTLTYTLSAATHTLSALHL